MTDLLDEVKESFNRAEDIDPSKGPIQLVSDTEINMAPGFGSMREYYNDRILVGMRRGYHWHAGSTMPHEGDKLLERTKHQMAPHIIALTMSAFTDGVMVGHRQHILVQMALHYNAPEHLFHTEEFRNASLLMCKGFTEVGEVLTFFGEYVEMALSSMAHMSGFAHSTDMDPAKVWDLWGLAATSVISSAYLAGNSMGTTWRERDVIDDMEITFGGEEGEPAGEAG